jgi:hypothetical protein
MKNRTRLAIGCAAALGLTTPAFASTGFDLAQPQGGGEWKCTLKPYFWAASVAGDVDLKNLPPQDVHVGFDDILDDLEFGAMLGFEARQGDGDFAYVGDLLYIDIDDDSANVDVSMEEFMGEFDVAFRPWEPKWIEGLVGLRYWYVDTEIDPTGPPHASKTTDWVDPIVGARATIPFGDRWASQIRGDIGGFDVGSKFTWQASADIQFAFSTSLSGTLGYRALNFDYEADRADYDMTMYGPWLGVNWSF